MRGIISCYQYLLLFKSLLGYTILLQDGSFKGSATAATQTPSRRPTFYPTIIPSKKPSFLPSQVPTFEPTVPPSMNPSSHSPTQPTVFPSFKPTFKPTTNIPTKKPSQNPSPIPTHKPTSAKPLYSLNPSIRPSKYPTEFPTVSVQPTTINPSLIPSTKPSSCAPTFGPTAVTAAPTTVIDEAVLFSVEQNLIGISAETFLENQESSNNSIVTAIKAFVPFSVEVLSITVESSSNISRRLSSMEALEESFCFLSYFIEISSSKNVGCINGQQAYNLTIQSLEGAIVQTTKFTNYLQANASEPLNSATTDFVVFYDLEIKPVSVYSTTSQLDNLGKGELAGTIIAIVLVLTIGTFAYYYYCRGYRLYGQIPPETIKSTRNRRDKTKTISGIFDPI